MNMLGVNLRKNKYLPVKDLCPVIETFDRTKLPTLKKVIGLVLHTAKTKGIKNAVPPVAVLLEKQWLEQNVYPVSRLIITKKLRNAVNLFDSLKRYDTSRLDTESFRIKYDPFVESLDKLFDIFDENAEHRATTCQTLRIAPMLSEDFTYLQSQRTDRQMECDKKTDHKYEKKVISDYQRQVKYNTNQYNPNISVSSETISDSESDQGDDHGQCDDNEEDESQDDDTSPPKKKKPMYMTTIEDYKDDPLPVEYQHVRYSHKGIVKDSICRALAEMDAERLSISQMQSALCIVGNICFSRKWKKPLENEDSLDEVEDPDSTESDETLSLYDQDRMPSRKAIRNILKKMEVYRMKLIANKICEENEKGSTICHATDSTTRKSVGTFAVGGFHINNKEFLPLPTVSYNA